MNIERNDCREISHFALSAFSLGDLLRDLATKIDHDFPDTFYVWQVIVGTKMGDDGRYFGQIYYYDPAPKGKANV